MRELPDFRPDPWHARAPFTWELTSAELYDFMLIAKRNPAAFNDWEHDFLISARAKLKWDGGLSLKQYAVLDSRLLAKLWTNDPDLWD